VTSPTHDDIRRDLEDAAQAVDREKVQDRLTPAARQRLVAATSAISDTLALAEAQIDVDELREENAGLRFELAKLREEAKIRQEKIDWNRGESNVGKAIGAIFGRANVTEIVIQKRDGGWRVATGSQERVPFLSGQDLTLLGALEVFGRHLIGRI
jgi:hypothetical protein